jgi:hypothetical protein
LRFVLHLLAMAAVALAVGFGLSWYALTDGRFFGAFEVGPWVTWPQVGVPNPDPYTRAHLARSGGLQLGFSEGLRFIAKVDSDGRPLSRACRYRVDGTTPVATFWTLTAADAQGVNITRPDGLTALRSNTLSRAPDGSINVYVSRTLAPRDWLEITGEGAFTLVLTLYDTSIFAGVGSGVSELPAIIREACT